MKENKTKNTSQSGPKPAPLPQCATCTHPNSCTGGWLGVVPCTDYVARVKKYALHKRGCGWEVNDSRVGGIINSLDNHSARAYMRVFLAAQATALAEAKEQSEYWEKRYRHAAEYEVRMCKAEADRALHFSQRWAEQAAREKAEATLARVMEWARGRCECCEPGMYEDGMKKCHGCKFLRANSKGTLDNWTPPAAWR